MEKRLIDAEKVIRDLTAMKTQLGVDAILIDGMIDGLKRQPKVDAVEVVRCKDCKHAWIHPCGYCKLPHMRGIEIFKEFFCYYGERKEGAD